MKILINEGLNADAIDILKEYGFEKDCGGRWFNRDQALAQLHS